MQLEAQIKRRRNVISLTPLIDVVFILLLFFMLSSVFTQWHQVDLPMPAGDVESEVEPVHVQLLDESGRFKIGEQVFEPGMQAELVALIAADPGAVYALDVKAGLTTQQMISVMDKFKQAGAQKIALAGVLP